MSDTYLNPQNGGYNPKSQSNYQSILSKNAPGNNIKNIYRPNNNPVQVNPGTYITFSERVEQSPYLISLEQKNPKNNKKKAKKKEINSYISNKDKLFIPKPERVHQGINIFRNLIEEEKKIVMVDLGIQSDEIEYDEIENEKKFLPQKLGKDEATQIMDGDLFDFDKDVQPLLTVVVGKTLEQSMLELEQEQEIENLKQAKLMYSKKRNDDSKRIKNLEEKEIQKKYNNDAKKEIRKQTRETRKKTQKQLISRFISKTYLRDLVKNSYQDLIYRCQFRDYSNATVKDKTNFIIVSGSKKLHTAFTNMNSFIKDSISNKLKAIENSHIKAVDDRHKFLDKIAKQREIIRQREEEARIRAEKAKIERRKLRRIERIQKETKTGIIDNGVSKGDAFSEETTEIGNFEKNDEPYIGIYGSFFGIFIATLAIVQKDCFQDESLYNIENIGEIMRMVFDETQSTVTLHFNEEALNKVTKIVQGENKPEDEEEGNAEKDEPITDLKNVTDLSTDAWNKIRDVLENIEYNNDIFLKNFIEDFSKIIKDKEGNELGPILKDDYIYKLIIGSLIDMCAKASYSDHYRLLFDKPKEEEENEEEKKEENEEEKEENDKGDKKEEKELTFKDVLNKYEAVCMLEWEKSTNEIINTCDFVRPSKKKNVPAPNLDSDFIQVKAYQNNPEIHNVLLYDRIAEFCLRNKVFECALAHFTYITSIENDSAEQFKSFNEIYDQYIDQSDISNTIQVYHYLPDKEKEPEDEEEN
jgi:hypothetical protein